MGIVTRHHVSCINAVACLTNESLVVPCQKVLARGKKLDFRRERVKERRARSRGVFQAAC